MAMSQNWVMVISEQHRYQGVSYKSDIIVISGKAQCSAYCLIFDITIIEDVKI